MTYIKNLEQCLALNNCCVSYCCRYSCHQGKIWETKSIDNLQVSVGQPITFYSSVDWFLTRSLWTWLGKHHIFCFCPLTSNYMFFQLWMYTTDHSGIRSICDFVNNRNHRYIEIELSLNLKIWFPLITIVILW